MTFKKILYNTLYTILSLFFTMFLAFLLGIILAGLWKLFTIGWRVIY